MFCPGIPSSFYYLPSFGTTFDSLKKREKKRKENHRLTFWTSSSLPLDAFAQPMNPVRKPCSHTIIPKDYANDDEVR